MNKGLKQTRKLAVDDTRNTFSLNSTYLISTPPLLLLLSASRSLSFLLPIILRVSQFSHIKETTGYESVSALFLWVLLPAVSATKGLPVLAIIRKPGIWCVTFSPRTTSCTMYLVTWVNGITRLVLTARLSCRWKSSCNGWLSVVKAVAYSWRPRTAWRPFVVLRYYRFADLFFIFFVLSSYWNPPRKVHFVIINWTNVRGAVLVVVTPL